MRKMLNVVLIAFTSCSILLARGNAKSDIYFADPTIYRDNGNYYLTGTRNIEPLGFMMLHSKNLKEWTVVKNNFSNMILEKSEKSFGHEGFWAPQILKENNKYWLTYTANEQVAIAQSATLCGLYTQKKVEPIDASEKNIDSYLFKDDDGKYYLYHVRFNKGNYLWVAEFDMATGKISPKTLKQCFGISQDWEATPAYKSDPIMEGPTVLKMKGIYYLLYSANHFENIDYAVGYATAVSPYGPWTKNPDNPIIHRSIVKENGSGHGDVFFDAKNNPYYVYHVHNSKTAVTPRRTRIVPLEFTFDTRSGLYNITANAAKIIHPILKK